jgi:hypothetical protein
MTNTQNTNTMKSTMIILATVLALVAAALLQTKAEAATAQVSTGSIEDAKQAGTNLPKGSGEAIKGNPQTKTQSTEGTFSTKSTLVSRSGSPGYVGLYPIQAYAYYNGYQYLTNAGAQIGRSSAYGGDQIITMRTRIYKQNYQNGVYYAWQTWATPTYHVRVGSTQYAQINRQWLYDADLAGNRYVADVQVWWRTPGGTVLGYKEIELNNSSDFRCMSTNCQIQGTEGSRMFLYLDYHYSGI